MPNVAQAELERDTMRRVGKRLLPLLMIAYLIAYLDRFNISVAALTMNQDIGLSATQFGLGSGLFFVTYVLFEVPSNVVLARVGARRWIARIMLTWGIISGAMALVQGAQSFYFLRLLLGAAEAGFTPGVVFYLARWFPSNYRTRAMAWFYVATALASVIGSPLSGVLLELHGWLGLAGWRWLFILEAAPAVLLSIIVWRRLTDSPAGAGWLPERNRTWLVETLHRERAEIDQSRTFTVLGALRNPGVLLLGLFFFLYSFNSNGLTIWMPQVIEGGFGTPSDLMTALLTAGPYVCAVIGMLITGRYCDRVTNRHLFLIVPMFIGALCLAGSTVLGGSVAGYVLLAVSNGFISSVVPAMWSVASSFMTGVAASAAIALINSIANIAGIVGPPMIGSAQQATGGFTAPLLLIALAIMLGSAVGAASRPFTRPERLSRALAR